MSKLAVYPGSFDPITLGHLDIIERSLEVFEHLQVVVVHNPGKEPFFTPAERVQMVTESLAERNLLSRVTVSSLDSGLLTTYAKQLGATVMIKGFRTGVDIEYELPMARVNRDLTGIETVFLPSDPGNTHISSSLVKQVAALDGEISKYVTASVIRAFKAKG
ncbi:MAG: pantetheine-phosphate adenylyltransferase [Actinobacteria bacterium]|uniref:Phosphopantetheine adenylyltransferase n=1 Tax=freshwater metagenome TaxID=449393 RepID=A0A6J6GKH6_9ZZZZ|nr:pantetheine-phosphate adenylyltransferase [Actinomycetota bacterium]MTA29298.1 pantetheine-phosphate adenylyltransferase [Actinomycetota bacterium]